VAMTENQVLELLRRIGGGDQAAMRTLYLEFSGKVHAYVANHWSAADRTEEIVVDSFHEVWRHPERFRGESRFSTFLIGIARYKMLSALRSTEPQHEDIEDFSETLAADQADVFQDLADRQRRDGVMQCMQRLSGEHRECLFLVFYEGMSLAEVARVQACPEGTVKSRIHTAKGSIRSCLQALLRRES
jgi:RNA polymerase sigma-70 factor, ECF subfamily